MRRRSMLIGVVLVALFATPSPASAAGWDWWDWMQEWSGPGPFRPRAPNVLATICKPFVYPDEGTNKPCFYFDYRPFIAEANARFPVDVEATAYDFGLTWRLRDSIELGLGFGFMHASGADDHSITKVTVTAPRVVVKPIVLIGRLFDRTTWVKTSSFDANRWPHIFKVYVRESLMFGDLEAADLGVSPAISSFKVKNDRVTSMGFLIDVGELIGR